MQRYELEKLSREELIVHASQLGVPRPRVLTQPELMDEIITRTAKSEREKAKARGWLGRARDLLAQVIEKKLHLPEAARVLRSGPDDRTWPTPSPPLPTVTLAEIY
ncbi:MAG: Rho termination factor N-terminal domain-containing protein, partial [Byssovorax sp.]